MRICSVFLLLLAQEVEPADFLVAGLIREQRDVLVAPGESRILETDPPPSSRSARSLATWSGKLCGEVSFSVFPLDSGAWSGIHYAPEGDPARGVEAVVFNRHERSITYDYKGPPPLRFFRIDTTPEGETVYRGVAVADRLLPRRRRQRRGSPPDQKLRRPRRRIRPEAPGRRDRA